MQQQDVFMDLQAQPSPSPIPVPLKCRVYNPTKRRRVIYPGLVLKEAPVDLKPGETKELVISRMTAKQLKETEFSDPAEGPDLKVTVLGRGEMPKEIAAKPAFDAEAAIDAELRAAEEQAAILLDPDAAIDAELAQAAA